MAVIRVRGVALPDGEIVDLYADGDRWTSEPVAAAQLVAEGWIVPGLVDAHTHPGADQPGQPLDEEFLREDLLRHLAAGVTMIRSPGLAGDAPDWYGVDPTLPRAVNAGGWISQPGQFFEGWGRKATLDAMTALAVDQARLTGWVKFIADWTPADPAIPLATMTEIVAAVHAVGGRVAVHSQNRAGSTAAVAAGVDSIEHGMHLDVTLLDQMARQGTALAPTLATFLAGVDEVARRAHDERRRWYLDGVSALPEVTVSAHEAGVRLLAGTDSHPTGAVADEIIAIANCGVPAHDALGAGSWSAREYLGLAGLVEGAPADAVVYDHDPREDLNELRRPRAIVLRGALVYRRN